MPPGTARRRATRATLTAFALAAAAQAAQAAWNEVSYMAQQGQTYVGDRLVSDSGAPTGAATGGDTALQVLLYEPELQDVQVMATFGWDDSTHSFVGLDTSSSTQLLSVKQRETVPWLYGGGSWIAGAATVETATLTLSMVTATPLLVAREWTTPPGGEPDRPLTELEIQELIMAGALAALRDNLDPNYSLDNITRSQLQRDLQRLENILAGVPEPQTWALMLGGALVLALRARRARPAG